MSNSIELWSDRNDRADEPAAYRDATTELFDREDFDAWHRIIDRLHETHDLLDQAERNALRNRTAVQAELLASGQVDEIDLYRSLAEELNIGFSATVDPDDIVTGERECRQLLGSPSLTPAARLRGKHLATELVIATDRLPLRHFKEFLHRHPALRHRLRVVPRKAMRAALFAKSRNVLMQEAVGQLFVERPELSARTVTTARQGFMLALAGLLTTQLLISFTNAALLCLHLASTIFFLGCVGLRGAALVSAAPNRFAKLSRLSPAQMPTYSVLVALYREAEIVPELLVALSSILWPRSKLEIKLVCEADDKETLEALRAHTLKPWVEIIEVPPLGPRTKPKALAYALPSVSGEFVALFDAEDRPHPAQLLEAWQTFRGSPPSVACLQAPLDISNKSRSLVSRMFGLEYSALFHGLLPFLSRWHLLIPLGGTSNHFRREALERVGGWDPFNVTEDADLGVRLMRHGYQTRTITRPTYEAAPDRWREWLPQRTRWFKGWCQTWLVHMREPTSLAREIGWGSFWVAQILFAGLVLSAIAHPVMIATGAWLVAGIARGVPLGTLHSVILAIDVVNIACGYATFLLLGWKTLDPRDRRGFWRIVVFTPIYWMMMSAAAWRAIWQLWRSPHRWEKTPHFRTEQFPSPATGR